MELGIAKSTVLRQHRVDRNGMWDLIGQDG